MTSLTLFLTFVGLLFESSRGPTMKFFVVKLKVESRLFVLSKNVLFKGSGGPRSRRRMATCQACQDVSVHARAEATLIDDPVIQFGRLQREGNGSRRGQTGRGPSSASSIDCTVTDELDMRRHVSSLMFMPSCSYSSLLVNI